ncbi:MAG: DUF2141 domain-containing protein, partial [Oligoflexia bacterium]|nr:DUF2141 domain-containing protein [Oligoflexia bacterium]
FLKEGREIKKQCLPIETSTAYFEWVGLPLGEYAVLIIHDENNNDRVDTNFFGIPKEGVGTSNNPVTRFRPPSFNQSKFELKDEETKLVIHTTYR